MFAKIIKKMSGLGKHETGSLEPRTSRADSDVHNQSRSCKGKHLQRSARDTADLRSENEVLRRRLAESARELKQVQQALAESSAKLKNAISENTRLTVAKQTLERQMSDLKERIKKAAYLENAAPSLLDWIQSVMGYAENKALFPSDDDELAQFRADVKRLPTLLRLNEIDCNNTPPDEGIGFVHKRDARIAAGKEVLSAPMLLRNGVLISDGIVLVPDVSEKPQKIPNSESAQGHNESCCIEKQITPSDAQSTKTAAEATQTTTFFDKEQLRSLDTEGTQTQNAITANVLTNPVDAQKFGAEDHLGSDGIPSSVRTADSTDNSDKVTPSSAITTSVVDTSSPTNLTAEGEQDASRDGATEATESSTYGQVSGIAPSVSSGGSVAKQADAGQKSPWEFDV